MRSLFGTILACLALVSTQSFAAVVQVLDSVDAFGRNITDSSAAVLEMGFRVPPEKREDFSRLAIGSASSLIACQRAADQGLYCLDGPVVRYWPNTGYVVTTGSVSVIPDIDLINCQESARALGLDTKRSNPCTSLTVDLNGSIWLAGRKANSHSLFKVISVKPDASCPADYVPLPRVAQDLPDTAGTPAGSTPGSNQSVDTFCAREYAFGRPILVDINPVDGEVAVNFTGPGILGLEERKTVAFFPDDVDELGQPLHPVEIASGKADWGLIGNEQLLSTAFLQVQAIPASKTAPAIPLQNFVVVTTTLGRVLATKADGSEVGFKVWDIPTCTSSQTQQYGIRVSSQSERVYLTDRACQKVYALKWTNVALGDFDLVPDVEGSPPAAVVLSTSSTPDRGVLPDGLSVAPGIGIDLAECTVGKVCTIVADGATDNNELDAANISGVVLGSAQSRLALFQVKGIPDCRYWPKPQSGQTPTAEQELCAGSVIRCDASGSDANVANCPNPKDQYLDIAPLLPEEVKLQLATLPTLLISPRYRGQNANRKADNTPTGPYAPTINLFFGIGEPGLQFRDTFRMSFDVGDLTGGAKWNCGGDSTPSRQPDLEWNVVITGSETYQVAHRDQLNSPFPERTLALSNVETLVNDGCTNPDGVSSKRFSYYAYTLEVVPDGDGVYGKLVRDLFDELDFAQQETACKVADLPTDGSTEAPLASDDCLALKGKWDGADDKLKKCISGTTYPRQSEAVNNCNSFLSQLGQYETALNAAPRLGQDPANRIGELKARVKVLRYVFQQHFVPSIPPNGFCSLTATGTCTP